MSNIKVVIQQLKSDKIKERQEGLTAIRTVFEKDKAINTFHLDAEGNVQPRTWLIVFQGIFVAALTEKNALGKKTNSTSKSAASVAAAERRLSDVASTLRWLVERTVCLLNKRVVKALTDHIFGVLILKGKLLAPVALDYIKTLKCLLSYPPHIDHLDEVTWVKIAELGFNVVLGDSLDIHFVAPNTNNSTEPATPANDSDFFAEDDYDEVDGENGNGTPTKKRRPRERTPAPSKGQPKATHRGHTSSVSLEQVECVSLLSLLLRSSAIPSQYSGYTNTSSSEWADLPNSILTRLQRFLEVYPVDTSLHHDFLLALLSTLSQLSLNQKALVVQFAQTSWSNLVALWGTKTKYMKEGLVSVLRVLFPFLTADSDTSDLKPFDWSEGITRLWSLMNGEAESRWGLDGLSIDALRLEMSLSPAGGDGGKAFVASTFRSGWGFGASQALIWAVLELQADCTEKVGFLFSISFHNSLIVRMDSSICTRKIQARNEEGNASESRTLYRLS